MYNKKRSGYTKKKPFKYDHAKMINKKKVVDEIQCKIWIVSSTETYNEVRNLSFNDI